MALKIIALIIVLSTACFSQEVNLKRYSVTKTFKSGKSIKQYGLKDQFGKIVLEPDFDSIYYSDLTYKQKNIRVTKNKKMGLVNSSGKLLLECRYDFICHPKDGLIKIRQNGLWGYIDKNERTVIDPKYLSLSQFVNKKTLAKTSDNKLVLVNLNGIELSEYDITPIFKSNYKLNLPNPKKGINFFKYFDGVLGDSLHPGYDFYNCADGEGLGGIIYRKLKFGIIKISEYGWENSIQRYIIPNFSIDKSVSILKNIFINSDYKMSKKEKVIFFRSKENWMEQFEIEEISPHVIEIRYLASS